MTNIYGILDTETNEFVSYNSKCAWSKVGNAKNAFALHSDIYDKFAEQFVKVKFDDQSRFVIVDLTEAYFRLDELLR
jgi:hypothetical protein